MSGQGIGFVLLSHPDRPLPSTRIAALNLFPALQRAGHRPTVCFAPETGQERPTFELSVGDLRARGIGCVVFQKVHGPAVERQAAALRAAGIKTVYMVCDLVEARMAAATDATVTVTEFLRSLYPAELRHKIHVVHDGIERPAVHKQAWADPNDPPGAPLRAVLVTSSPLDQLPTLRSPPPWMHLRVVGRYGTEGVAPRWRDLRAALFSRHKRGRRFERAGFALDRRITCVPWSPDGAYQELLSAHIGLIPSEVSHDVAPPLFPVPHWKVKSENRLTLMMAAALPVVASPVPSYIDVIEHGRNGYLAHDRQEWLRALDDLRDPLRREQVGRLARATVIERYSIEAQARRFLSVLQQILPPARTTADNPLA